MARFARPLLAILLVAALAACSEEERSCPGEVGQDGGHDEASLLARGFMRGPEEELEDELLLTPDPPATCRVAEDRTENGLCKAEAVCGTDAWGRASRSIAWGRSLTPLSSVDDWLHPDAWFAPDRIGGSCKVVCANDANGECFLGNGSMCSAENGQCSQMCVTPPIGICIVGYCVKAEEHSEEPSEEDSEELSEEESEVSSSRAFEKKGKGKKVGKKKKVKAGKKGKKKAKALKKEMRKRERRLLEVDRISSSSCSARNCALDGDACTSGRVCFSPNDFACSADIQEFVVHWRYCEQCQGAAPQPVAETGSPAQELLSQPTF